jgi:tetratricopeptide (TPR) repeat protein
MAYAKFGLDQIAEAIKDFDKAIEYDSSNNYAYKNRALCKKKLNDLEGSLKDYSIAIANDSCA